MRMKKVFKILSVVFAATLLCASFAGCSKINNKPYQKGEYEREESQYSDISGDKLVNGDSLVKWEGRYEYVKNVSDKVAGASGSAVMLYNTATGFTVNFTGTTLKVTFIHNANDIYYNFAVDGETLPNPAAGRRFYLPDGEIVSEVTLVKDLPHGEHKVTCLKMDEAADAYTAVSAFSTDGKFMYRNTAEDADTLKFMFICASGGSGHGSLYYSTEATKSRVGRTRRNSSSLHAFNYLVARMYDADVQFVAQSGWGVKYPKSMYDVLDYTGITPDNSVAAAKETAKWDWAQYVPDVVIMNIGGNDTNASSFVKETYQKTCVNMVKKVHENYPNAVIIWTHTGSKAGTYASEAFRADEEIAAGGYLHDCIIPQKGYGNSGWGSYGANDHNSFKTHIDTAEVLTAYLKKLGFYPVRENVTFEEQKSFLLFDDSTATEKPAESFDDYYVYPVK